MGDILTEAYNHWREVVFRICRKEVAVFENNHQAYTDDLIFNNCRRHFMRWMYGYICNYAKIPRIEDLSQEEKVKLWEFVKDICKGKTDDVNKMKDICKVFYTIEYFLNNPQN